MKIKEEPKEENINDQLAEIKKLMAKMKKKPEASNKNLFEKVSEALKNKKNMSSTELKEIMDNQKKMQYSYSAFYKFFSKERIKEWYKRKFKRGRIFLIDMLLRNGKYEMFTVTDTTPFFEHRGGCYIIDPDMTREDLHSKLDRLTYHQDFSAPFKISYDTKAIHGVIMDSKEDRMVDKALNPSSIKRFIESEVIEKLLKADQLIDKLKLLLILAIVGILINVVTLLMVFKASRG
jgi:hypothetical protein